MASPSQKQDEDREFPFHEEDFRFLVKFIYERAGIVLADHKRDMVYSRLARRLRTLGLSRFSDYCALIQSPDAGDELGHLLNAITTNLTSFFREGHHFEHLGCEVLRPLAQQWETRRLRLWSAGCSSGMEAYSMAMTLRASIPNLASWDARILATDIDTNMLNTGERGEYAYEQFKNTPSEYHSLITASRDKSHFTVDESLHKLLAFKHLNLLGSWPMKGPFHAIFCRNVVIYFDKPTQQKLFARLANMLVPGGWLYIGHSENLMNVSDRFAPAGRTIYRRID